MRSLIIMLIVIELFSIGAFSPKPEPEPKKPFYWEEYGYDSYEEYLDGELGDIIIKEDPINLGLTDDDTVDENTEKELRGETITFYLK